MKAVVINRYGSPDVLQYTDVAEPQIKSDQMLVKVHATSINPIDWKIRQGMLRLLTGNKFPIILGFDVSGEVGEIGDRVSRFQVGDLIYARLDSLSGGAYAGYAAVSEKVASRKPVNMTHEEAAAVPLAAMTALQALRDEGKLEEGQKVLINGASGGVGTFAVQIAKVLGAEVTAVCSTRNVELVESLGADRAIDYTQEDTGTPSQGRGCVRRRTANLVRPVVPRDVREDFTQDTIKYDIVFDVVGNRSLSECKDVLQPNGIYITTQPLPGKFFQSFLTGLLPGQKYKVILMRSNSADLAYLTEQIEASKIRSVIDRTYPLTEIAAAHTYSETERAVGKIVITTNEN